MLEDIADNAVERTAPLPTQPLNPIALQQEYEEGQLYVEQSTSGLDIVAPQ